jgi:hypothetical protein
VRPMAFVSEVHCLLPVCTVNCVQTLKVIGLALKPVSGTLDMVYGVCVFNHGFCCVRVSSIGLCYRLRLLYGVESFDRNLHSRMPLDPTPLLLRLKLLHACDQWHSSRVSTSSNRLTPSP